MMFEFYIVQTGPVSTTSIPLAPDLHHSERVGRYIVKHSSNLRGQCGMAFGLANCGGRSYRLDEADHD